MPNLLSPAAARRICRGTVAALALLTAPQATASTVLPGLEDYPFEVSENAENIYTALLQIAANTPVPAITRDPITLYFEAELETAEVINSGGTTTDSAGLAALADRTPKAGEKITGSLTYNPNRNLLVERVADQSGLQGLTYEEIDELLGGGQYFQTGFSYTYDGVTRTYSPGPPLQHFVVPDGQQNVSDEALLASRSLFLGNNASGGDSVAFGSTGRREAEVTISTAYQQACQSELTSAGVPIIKDIPQIDTRPIVGIGLNVAGPDFLPGTARDLTQTVYTQGQNLTRNAFNFVTVDFFAPTQAVPAPQIGVGGNVSSDCASALRAFFESLPIIRGFSATGRITYLSPTRVPTGSPPPVAAVPVPPALGFGLTWLLMLGLARLRRKPA